MSLDEHTAAAISEIDRTLRSLGFRDDFNAPPLPPRMASSCTSEAPREPAHRHNAASQTAGPSSVSAGVQTCVHSVQRGVQHCPRVQTAAAQTEPLEEVPPYLHSILQTAATTSSFVVDHITNLTRAFSTVSRLTEKVHALEKKTRCVAAQLATSRSEMAVLAVEKDEQLARSGAVAGERSARLEIAAWHIHELTRRATALEPLRPAGGCEAQQCSTGPKLCEKSPAGCKDTPNTSLNDLTELLDECWRVLEE